MKAQKFTLSLIALSVASSFAAHAEIYDVVEVDPASIDNSVDTYSSSFGVAVEPYSNSVSSPDCFDGSATGCSSYAVGVETRRNGTLYGQPVDGLDFKNEAPFRSDSSYYYFSNDESGFQNFCSAVYKYADSFCDNWGSTLWNEWQQELGNSTEANANSFIVSNQGSISITQLGTNLSVDHNLVINQLTGNGASVEAIGSYSSLADSRTTRSSYSEDITANTTFTTLSNSSKSMAFGESNSIYFGSVFSTAYNTYGTFTSTKPAILDVSGDTEITWPSGLENASNGYRIAQGSIRGLISDGSDYYAVGYTSWSSYNYLNATVFFYDASANSGAGSWSQYKVSDAQVKPSDDVVYTNTLFTAVNDNKVAIGEAKRAVASNDALANRLFLIDDVSDLGSGNTLTDNAQYFSDTLADFSGAGGHANAINNYNEIVGQIDTESVREVSGKPRAKRGFIYPYEPTDSLRDLGSARRTSVFADKAWLLDDLTNDGSASGANNYFRILSANDINDAGVIAATAFKCSTGYETTEYDADCSGTESVVAVKLVPIAGNDSTDIIARSYKSTTVERQGAGSGIFVLLGLALTAFSRKKSLFFVKSGR